MRKKRKLNHFVKINVEKEEIPVQEKAHCILYFVKQY